MLLTLNHRIDHGSDQCLTEVDMNAVKYLKTIEMPMKDIMGVSCQALYKKVQVNELGVAWKNKAIKVNNMVEQGIRWLKKLHVQADFIKSDHLSPLFIVGTF